MSLISWSEGYSVNIKEIDRQHKKMLDAINDLNENFRLSKPKDVINKNLEELLNYTIHHFSYEEKLLLEHGFPEANLHIHSHFNLMANLKAYIKEFESGSTFSHNEFLNFLFGWLENHVVGADRNYSAFLNSKGIY